jgi:hypothetical protein
MTDEEFVKSIYPRAEIQQSAGLRKRIVTEPTFGGLWIGAAFPNCEREKWKNAAEYLRREMLRKLEL